jgi:hypothetical protein
MESLSLSLDPRTLESASGRQKVAYVDPDRGLVYEEPYATPHYLAQDQMVRTQGTDAPANYPGMTCPNRSDGYGTSIQKVYWTSPRPS